jgi:hypothetical protein
MRRVRLALPCALLVLSLAPAATAGVAPTPDQTWMVDGPRVQDIIATDTLVFLGGAFDAAIPEAGSPGVRSHNLVALDAVTTEPEWTQNVGYASGERSMVWDLELAADGRTLYVCGSFDRVGGVERTNIASLDAATGRLLPWVPDGVSACRSIAAFGDTVIVGGGASIRSVMPDGSTGWIDRTDGPVLTITSDGTSLFAGGRFSRIDDVEVAMVAKLDPGSGSADPGWDLGSVPITDRGEGPFAIDLLIDRGSLFVAAGGADYAARHDVATGDLAWWTDTSGSVQALERISWGTVVLGGHFQWVADADTTECGTNDEPVTTCSDRLRLASLNAHTGEVRGWNPGVTGAYTGVWSLDVDTAGRLHVGGEFTGIGGQEQLYYARLRSLVAL